MKFFFNSNNKFYIVSMQIGVRKGKIVHKNMFQFIAVHFLSYFLQNGRELSVILFLILRNNGLELIRTGTKVQPIIRRQQIMA